uniref:Small ribosomal subunit protein uS4c n=1 Tax=Boodleopsis sp. FL1161 TaxID=2364084 RepID=A0A386AZ79_9CHLO|nr:ribosomal protein S4 [Boodleopsis sp. FL1161]
MSRYLGPKLRVLKRLGFLPGFGEKINQKYKLYEQKKKDKFTLKNKNKNKTYSYTLRLIEKQKLRYNFGLTEKKLAKYVKNARKRKKYTGIVLLTSLAMRLDNIIFQSGFTPTLAAARQLVTHGHIYLNGKKKTQPSFLCKIQDSIKINEKIKTINYFSQYQKVKEPPFLILDLKNNAMKLNDIVKRRYMDLNINELLVVEYYSRRNG